MDKRMCQFLGLTLLSLLVCFLLRPGSPAFAQSGNAQLSGLITDSSGASIPGAKVAAVNTATNVTLATETNTGGIYEVPQLIPGPYKVTVSKAGFKTIERLNVVLHNGDRLSLDFTLQVGTLTENITVTAEAPLLQVSDTTSANVIDNKLITELPQLTRYTTDYMGLNPSVIIGPVGGPKLLGNATYMVGLQGAQYSIGAGLPNGTTFSVDGANMNEGDSNVINRAIPTPDAIAELRVQSGALTADSGRYSGGTVTMSTLSGTSAFHGKLFEYFRNQSLNANSWFNNNHDIATTPYHQNNFGAAIGGPVWIPKLYNGRNRTFFFVSWEAQRFNSGTVSESTVPTAEERQGIFTNVLANYGENGQPVPMQIFDPYNGYTDPSGNWVRPQFANAVIPSKDWDPFGHSVINAFPLPNHAPLANTSNEDNYFATVKNSLPLDLLTFRVDENISPMHRVNLRATRYHASDDTSAPFKWGQGQIEDDKNWSGSLQYVWTPSPTSIFEARAGFSISDLLIATGMTPDPSLDETTLGLDPMAFGTGVVMNKHILPGGDFCSYWYTCIGGYYPDHMPASNYNATFAYTKILGRHTLKGGVEYYHTAMHERAGDPSGINYLYAGTGPASSIAAPLGTWQYPSTNNNTGYAPADLLLGSATLVSAGIGDYSPFMRSFAGYVMDDWKVNSKLTVQMGLRIDRDGPKRMHYADTALRLDMTAKNVLTPNPGWSWGQVQAAVPGLSSYPDPAWLTSGINGRVTMLGSPESPGDVIWDSPGPVWQPRLGISYALDKQTVIHLTGGVIYQGMYGMGVDASNSITILQDSFSSVLTLDGMRWISELGLERGFGLFPLQPDGSHLGYTPAIKNNKQFWYDTLGGDAGPFYATQQSAPQEYDWGASFQRQIGNAWVATAEYQGIRGIHMVTPSNGFKLNALPIDYYSLGATMFTPVPNPFNGQTQAFAGAPTIPLWRLLSRMPQYNPITYEETTWGYMMAHYLNFQIQSRGWHGLGLLASYQNRHTYTTNSAKDARESGPANWGYQNPYNFSEAYGPANYEIPQRLMFEYSYDLPVGRGRYFMSNPASFAGKVLDKVIGGWGLAGVSMFWPHGTVIQMPRPANANTAPGASLFYTLIPGQYKSGNYKPSCALVNNNQFVSSNPCSYFNRDGFFRTPNYGFGTMGRNFIDARQPGGFSTDASILKNFYFSAEHSRYFQIRAEATDFLNHPLYGTIFASPSSPVFGGINGKSGSRIMQIGARIYF